jgi:hypothetical protein
MVRFNYSATDECLISHILDSNSKILSRTRHGTSDTSASSLKKPQRLLGMELVKRSAENERRAYSFLCATSGQALPKSSGNWRHLLFEIADIVNDGLLPAGPLREWNLKSFAHASSGPSERVPASSLECEIDVFCEQLSGYEKELLLDPVPVAASIEWALNGGHLHPFYDGCGRISRIMSACVLIRSSCLLPLYDTRESYFTHGNLGRESFAGYVQSCILRALHLEMVAGR